MVRIVVFSHNFAGKRMAALAIAAQLVGIQINELALKSRVLSRDVDDIDALLQKMKDAPEYRKAWAYGARNRAERRDQRFGRSEPRWGLPGWKRDR